MKQDSRNPKQRIGATATTGSDINTILRGGMPAIPVLPQPGLMQIQQIVVNEDDDVDDHITSVTFCVPGVMKQFPSLIIFSIQKLWKQLCHRVPKHPKLS